MARPALSASRSIDVIDFLAAFPGQGFTLSEIAKATKVNIASCHAVLAALVDRGYLVREGQRHYRLGPALVAIGEAALVSQPLIARARDEAAELARKLGVSTLITSVIGDEIVCVVSAPHAGGDGDMTVGERLPLVPPVGAPFLAWAKEPDIARWIARHEPPADAAMIALWRRSLALTRQRGFHVTLRSQDDRTIASMMADLAAGRRATDYKDAVTRLFNSFDRHMAQPETIEPDQSYDIVLIAAPVFDKTGGAAFNLCLGGFTSPLSGATIATFADRLVRTCLKLVREDRG